jgi:hypothetical protein
MVARPACGMPQRFTCLHSPWCSCRLGLRADECQRRHRVTLREHHTRSPLAPRRPRKLPSPVRTNARSAATDAIPWEAQERQALADLAAARADGGWPTRKRDARRFKHGAHCTGRRRGRDVLGCRLHHPGRCGIGLAAKLTLLQRLYRPWSAPTFGRQHAWASRHGRDLTPQLRHGHRPLPKNHLWSAVPSIAAVMTRSRATGYRRPAAFLRCLVIRR